MRVVSRAGPGLAAFLVALLLFVTALAFPAQPLVAQPLRELAAPVERLSVVTETGAHTFNVEIAETNEERARGLMFRTEMAPDHGMLFDFGRMQETYFWMKNTPLPLDMVFIRENGTVANIAQYTTPFSETPVPSHGPVRFVLELVGGTAHAIGLKAGDRVVHARIASGD
ncbi:DUF192 domain-containing protein [Breoghania sp. L-A4]|nr:DUF192 domain-containing protein [Breoghania sp. L-A4]